MKIARMLFTTLFAISFTAVSAHAQAAKKDSTHAMAPKTPAAAPAAAHWTKEQITDAQKGLAKAGFYKGAANGVWTHATTQALRAWQRANKMTVTGHLTNEELEKLKGG